MEKPGPGKRVVADKARGREHPHCERETCRGCGAWETCHTPPPFGGHATFRAAQHSSEFRSKVVLPLGLLV